MAPRQAPQSFVPTDCEGVTCLAACKNVHEGCLACPCHPHECCQPARSECPTDAPQQLKLLLAALSSDGLGRAGLLGWQVHKVAATFHLLLRAVILEQSIGSAQRIFWILFKSCQSLAVWKLFEVHAQRLDASRALQHRGDVNFEVKRPMMDTTG